MPAEEIPQQETNSDCGMFTCKYADYISRGQPITFSQQHMPLFRKKMVWELLHQCLLEPYPQGCWGSSGAFCGWSRGISSSVGWRAWKQVLVCKEWGMSHILLWSANLGQGRAASEAIYEIDVPTKAFMILWLKESAGGVQWLTAKSSARKNLNMRLGTKCWSSLLTWMYGFLFLILFFLFLFFFPEYSPTIPNDSWVPCTERTIFF